LPQPTQPDLEILDLRHFAGVQLQPLLRDEAARWNQRLHWDYTRAAQLLLEHIDDRILPGYVALRHGAITGFAFCVYEAAKAVVGDLYALNETGSRENPICETLLTHLLELLKATPGIYRIESQLLMFPTGALAGPYRAAGFHSIPRLFMSRTAPKSGAPHLASEMWEKSHNLSLRVWPGAPSVPLHGTGGADHLTLRPWQPSFYDAAADLIHRAYTGHMDANINDQYRTLHGAQRFLHNIIRFPGCGIFAPDLTWALQDRRTNALHGLILASRVRPDTAHITQLCINPSLQHIGLGSYLLHHCITEATHRGVTTLNLTVTEANTGALHLYERLGFETTHHFEAWVWEK
jgi:ribosomal protein S18 acetylase RimI-like enzyme